MNKYLETLRNDFQGSADALIDKAQDVAKTLKLDQEATEGNERLLRHYVSMGVVDKPSREGRDALYGFRHLVQFVAARRLLAEGFPLAKIAKYTGAVPTDALTAYLENQTAPARPSCWWRHLGLSHQHSKPLPLLPGAQPHPSRFKVCPQAWAWWTSCTRCATWSKGFACS